MIETKTGKRVKNRAVIRKANPNLVHHEDIGCEYSKSCLNCVPPYCKGCEKYQNNLCDFTDCIYGHEFMCEHERISQEMQKQRQWIKVRDKLILIGLNRGWTCNRVAKALGCSVSVVTGVKSALTRARQKNMLEGVSA